MLVGTSNRNLDAVVLRSSTSIWDPWRHELILYQACGRGCWAVGRLSEFCCVHFRKSPMDNSTTSYSVTDASAVIEKVRFCQDVGWLSKLPYSMNQSSPSRLDGIISCSDSKGNLTLLLESTAMHLSPLSQVLNECPCNRGWACTQLFRCKGGMVVCAPALSNV